MQNNAGNPDLAPITLKWDPKNLEIKTRSVERTLEPLVIQVTVYTMLRLIVNNAQVYFSILCMCTV